MIDHREGVAASGRRCSMQRLGVAAFVVTAMSVPPVYAFDDDEPEAAVWYGGPLVAMDVLMDVAAFAAIHLDAHRDTQDALFLTNMVYAPLYHGNNGASAPRSAVSFFLRVGLAVLPAMIAQEKWGKYDRAVGYSGLAGLAVAQFLDAAFLAWRRAPPKDPKVPLEAP
jgi:hypothetical protein